jgi:hypothetical protein
MLLVALCAIATCPTAKRSCSAKNHAQEANDLVDYLADRVAASITATGHVPPAAAGPTPTLSCCDQGGACSAEPSVWATPGWQALAFSIDDEHYYQYTYLPDPGGRSAIVRAVGDLDCNGETSLYEVEVRIETDGVKRTWTRKNPYE